MAEPAPPPAPSATRPKRKRQPVDLELYALLDVEWTATDEELKKAYRKRALRLHPDKPGGSAEQFTKMKKAYDVLSDPKKRETYDKYGPEMLRVMEGEAGPDAYVRLMLKQSKSLRVALVLLFCFVAGLLVVTPVLQAVRWDGAPWSWALVFVPMWFFQAVMYASWLRFFTAANSQPAPEGEAPVRLPLTSHQKLEIVVNTLGFCLLVVFEAFLSVKLDRTVGWSWYGVIAPWIIFEFGLVLWRLYGARVAAEQTRESLGKMIAMFEEVAKTEVGLDEAALHDARLNIQRLQEERDSVHVARSYIVYASFWPALRFMTCFLLAAKANGDIPQSYFATASPLIIGVLLGGCGEAMVRDPTASSFMGSACAAMSGHMIWLLVWLLAMGKLDNWLIYSAFAVWGPYFVVVGLVVLCGALPILLAPDLVLGEPKPAATDQPGGAQAQPGDAAGEGDLEQQKYAAQQPRPAEPVAEQADAQLAQV
jgi:hypothetical protein